MLKRLKRVPIIWYIQTGVFIVVILAWYSVYVSIAGYPDEWDQITPCSSLTEVIDTCGKYSHIAPKYGELIWRSYHLVGWFDLERFGGHLVIRSYIGIGEYSIDTGLSSRHCGECVE